MSSCRYVTFEKYEVHGESFVCMSIQSSELFNQKSLEEQRDQLNQKLPGFILSNMICEITGDATFRIERMARKDWKLPEKYTVKEDFKA